MLPWDSKYGEGFDVFKSGASLLALVRGGYVFSSHLGTPCQSLTWCRSPQLRSAEWPKGMPGLTTSQQQLVDIGNSLLMFSVEFCTLLYSYGSYFSIENPELSWLWVQPELLDLYSYSGVATVLVYYKDFGTPYLKPTLFLHNSPTLHGLRTPSGPLMFAAGHSVGNVVLRGMCWWEGQRVFRTHLAQPYPPDLGARFGSLTASAFKLRAEALSAGSEVPMASPEYDYGIPARLVAPFLSQGADEEARANPSELAGGQCSISSQDRWLVASETDDCPDADDPFVADGLGAPKGLSPIEHVAWACTVPHPSVSDVLELPDDLESAISFVSTHTPGQVDEWRSERLHRMSMKAQELQTLRDEWSGSVVPALRPLVTRLNGPLFEWLYHSIEYEDPLLLHDLKNGFPLLGALPPSCGSCNDIPPKFKSSSITEEELKRSRRKYNDLVLSSLRDDEWEDDIWQGTIADAEDGYMTYPVPLSEVDLSQVLLTRRLGVREERAKGWRTRLVDHFTESGVNPATGARDRIQHDGTDLLVRLVLSTFRRGKVPVVWKRDISQAFRRVPVKESHLDCAWVVFLRGGKPFVSRHCGMPFGSTSAVYGWHRLGHFLRTVAVRYFRAPAGRYVDDYFGSDPEGVRYTGGRCLSLASNLLGVPTAPEKDADDRFQMTVLGVDCVILPEAAAVTLQVDSEKAARWTAQLEEILATGVLEQGMASKMAGRLSFAVSAAAGRVGRAFLKPFFAQANDPLPGGRASPWLLRAAEWFIHYLRVQPPLRQEADLSARRHVRTWSDAAGVSRWVAAVVEVDGEFLWTRVRTPDHIWRQLLERGDQQIGVQEMLGVALAWGTYSDILKGTRWTSFVDNQGVLGAILKGGSGAPEVNMAVGHLWLDLAAYAVDLHVARVESKANISDGPSRDDFEEIARLGARYVDPVLPQWSYDLWGIPRAP